MTPPPGVFRARPAPGRSAHERDGPMDPKACLDRAMEAYIDGETGETQNALNDYLAWRREGGCEPTMDDGMRGDAFAAKLVTMMMKRRKA